MKTKLYLPIGDWSKDGHGECEKYLVETDKTMDDVREAHFNIKEKLGIDIHKFANEYEQNYITNEQCLELVEVGLNINKYLSNNYVELTVKDLEKPYDYYIEAEEIAALWIDLLNKVDYKLNLKLVGDENKIEMLAFYGFDEKKRHIGFVGYGTLGD